MNFFLTLDDSAPIPEYRMVLKAEGSEWRAQKWLNLTLEECVEKRTHDCKVISGRDYEPSPIVRHIIYVERDGGDNVASRLRDFCHISVSLGPPY